MIGLNLQCKHIKHIMRSTRWSGGRPSDQPHPSSPESHFQNVNGNNPDPLRLCRSCPSPWRMRRPGSSEKRTPLLGRSHLCIRSSAGPSRQRNLRRNAGNFTKEAGFSVRKPHKINLLMFLLHRVLRKLPCQADSWCDESPYEYITLILIAFSSSSPCYMVDYKSSSLMVVWHKLYIRFDPALAWGIIFSWHRIWRYTSLWRSFCRKKTRKT